MAEAATQLRPEINWYPTSARKTALFRRVLSFYRSGWRNKLRP